LDVRREVNLHGVKYLLETKRLQLRNVTIWGTFILPRASFMGHIDKSSKYVQMVILAVVVAVLVAGCILIVVLTDPISKEMQLKAQVIENLEARRRAELHSELKTKFLASMR
jgi:outer membrane murein-binding lipoprotein Lpp